MSVLPKNQLKGLFESGDLITQTTLVDLIDAAYNDALVAGSGVTLNRVTTPAGTTITINTTVIPDKTFVFTQPVPSASWSIQHDLDKFPSVSVVNNNNILMYGNAEYINNNNIIITFSGGFSGKAYLN